MPRAVIKLNKTWQWKEKVLHRVIYQTESQGILDSMRAQALAPVQAITGTRWAVVMRVGSQMRAFETQNQHSSLAHPPPVMKTS